jgi:minor extracellular protease Epr
LTSDKRGRVVFPVPASRKTAQYVIAHPTHSYWPGTVTKLALTDGKTLTLQCHSIESRPNDSIDELFGSNPTDGAGVTVAIIDGGVGPHRDLALAAPGQTFVSPSTATTDNGVGHGTHVAGIIRRLAPAAKLLSYRVFPKDSMSTDGAFVAAAIRKAVRDGAQVINISLTFERDYPILQETLKLAQAQGVICVCAAGNNAGPVMPPARYAAAVAVAACGKKTWPKGSLDHELKKPAGKKQRSIFAATFTCFGPEVTLSAPGVGIVSTFPKNRRAVMSGTSMSAPVISGLLARSLSGNLRRSTAVGVARAVAATRSLVASAKLLGLRSGYEGHGVPFLR